MKVPLISHKTLGYFCFQEKMFTIPTCQPPLVQWYVWCSSPVLHCNTLPVAVLPLPVPLGRAGCTPSAGLRCVPGRSAPGEKWGEGREKARRRECRAAVGANLRILQGKPYCELLPSLSIQGTNPNSSAGPGHLAHGGSKGLGWWRRLEPQTS